MIAVISAIFGLVVGSFLNVCIYRIPKGISIVTPPSGCPGCGKRIRPYHNIPVLSFLFLGGRCSYCGMNISYRYPLIEAFNALLYAATVIEFGLTPQSFFYMALLSALIVITFIDLETMIIPDVITLPGILVAFVCGSTILSDPLAGIGVLGPLSSLIGLLTGGGLFLVIAIVSKGGMGGGDIKLMALFGAAMGWKAALLITFIGSLFGSVYGIGLMIITGKGRKTRVPFGPFLAAGAATTIFFGRDLLLMYLGQ